MYRLLEACAAGDGFKGDIPRVVIDEARHAIDRLAKDPGRLQVRLHAIPTVQAVPVERIARLCGVILGDLAAVAEAKVRHPMDSGGADTPPS